MNNTEKMDIIKKYEKYLTYDEPIPYVPKKIEKKMNKIRKKIQESKVSKEGQLSNEEKQELYEELRYLSKQYIYIYPIKIKDYINFMNSLNCLLIEKNQIPDPNIISMSYLEFLFNLISNDENGEVYYLWFLNIIRMCLNTDPDKVGYTYEKNKVQLEFYNNENSEGNNENSEGNNEKSNEVNNEDNKIIIDKDDFNEIKSIICHQNIIDYDDSYIDPQVKKALDEAQQFKNKKSNKMCNFEEQIGCVMIALSESDEKKIYDMTIRKFSMILRRYDHKLHYEIFQTASMSGSVEFKKDIDHWMGEISKGKYDDVLVEYGQFENKMKSANA